MRNPFRVNHAQIPVPEKPKTSKDKMDVMFDYLTNSLPHIIAEQNAKIDRLWNLIFVMMAVISIVIAIVQVLGCKG